MKLNQCINRAYRAATGKATELSEGTTKYQKLLSIANSMQNVWFSEPGVEWDSRYDSVRLGTISARNTYDLDDTIQHLSRREGDSVYVIHRDGAKTYYDTISPSEMTNQMYGSYCCVRRGSLVFLTDFTTESPQFGGALMVPAYLNMEELKTANQDIEVDDPEWLVYAMAAEYARNDTTKSAQYNTLQNVANNLMNKMKEQNGGQITGVQRYPTVMGESWGDANIWRSR